MTYNLLHTARMWKDAGGIPTYGNRRDVEQEHLGQPRVPLAGQRVVGRIRRSRGRNPTP